MYVYVVLWKCVLNLILVRVGINRKYFIMKS